MRVYVAGAYNADNIVKALDNMREGMRLATKVMLAGHSPFVPWFDYHFQLMLRGEEKLSIQDYYRYSIDWLLVSDCMLVVPNSENSRGTQEEIKIAQEKGIPIYYDLDKIPQSW